MVRSRTFPETLQFNWDPNWLLKGTFQVQAVHENYAEVPHGAARTPQKKRVSGMKSMLMIKTMLIPRSPPIKTVLTIISIVFVGGLYI